jgi:hypothetical protein
VFRPVTNVAAERVGLCRRLSVMIPGFSGDESEVKPEGSAEEFVGREAGEAAGREEEPEDWADDHRDVRPAGNQRWQAPHQ